MFLSFRLLAFCLLFISIVICFDQEDNNYASDDEALSYVTYGSLLKLRHVSTGYRLHSHEVNYGSGSKQQSVTAVSQGDDVNSFWIIKGANGEFIPQGTPIKHGDKFRLQHTKTSKNLHSHNHRAPLTSDGFEVSCFGSNGEGDAADDWVLEVPSRSGYWKRGESVRIKHNIEGTYLASHQRAFGRPIEGQHEVKAVSKKRDTLCLWKTEEGVYFEANFDEDN